jgi:agmatine deiminase
MTQAGTSDNATARASTSSGATTPRADGFTLPARFERHQRTLLSWPCRADLFGPLMDDARKEWAEVARGIARFEPVTVVVDPAQEDEARELLLGEAGGASGPAPAFPIDLLPIPLDDSWIRDNGPIFVRGRDGEVAAVRFGFDGWGEHFTPYDKDAEVPARLAEAWGVRCYQAPFVLEGGAFNTDGQGTLLTTEQCLLHHRNLGLSRRDNERLLGEWLGVEKVIWLPFGLVEDSGPLSTSGHVDDVAQFAAPGVVLAQTCEPDNVNYSRLQENLEVLEAATDAAGRRLEVVESPLLPYVSGVGAGLDGVSGPGAGIRMPAPYVNMVFVEGAVLLPLTGADGEAELHAEIGELVGREPVGLPTELSAFGGGGLGCITQQVPAGSFAPPR